jgi:hypothetical protein
MKWIKQNEKVFQDHSPSIHHIPPGGLVGGCWFTVALNNLVHLEKQNDFWHSEKCIEKLVGLGFGALPFMCRTLIIVNYTLKASLVIN